MSVCFLFYSMGYSPLLSFFILIFILFLTKLDCSFWHTPTLPQFFEPPFAFWHNRCFRFILHLPCPSAGITRFSNEPWKIVFGSQGLGFRCAHCHWVLSVDINREKPGFHYPNMFIYSINTYVLLPSHLGCHPLFPACTLTIHPERPLHRSSPYPAWGLTLPWATAAPPSF